MLLNANKLDYKVLNENLRKAHEHCTITDCCGQRFIAAGMSDKEITIDGVPETHSVPISTVLPLPSTQTPRMRSAIR